MYPFYNLGYDKDTILIGFETLYQSHASFSRTSKTGISTHTFRYVSQPQCPHTPSNKTQNGHITNLKRTCGGGGGPRSNQRERLLF